MKEFRFGTVEKDPNESLTKVLDWFNLCANFWRPNEEFASGEFIHPPIATGFTYQASGSGRSSTRQPRWPTVLGQTVIDGSLTWTCTAAGSNGLTQISAPFATAPDGITASPLSVAETTKLLVTYSGGIDGQTYDVPFTVVINFSTRVGRQRVRVRKK